MGSTVYRQATMEVVHQYLKEDKRWGSLLGDIQYKMMSGYYTDLDIFGQLFHETYDIFDAYSFISTWCYIASGQILTAKIYVGHSPESDNSTDINNKLLSNLPKPFSAIFTGGPGDNDGALKWDTPITLGQITIDNIEKKQIISAGNAPLEVGYTKFENTYYHLFSDRKLARWPYGDDWITLLAVVDSDILTPDYLCV